MARVGTTGNEVRGRALRADLAFRQPLARDLRRAVTHRAHLFLFCSLHRSRHGFVACIVVSVPPLHHGSGSTGGPRVVSSPFRALSTLRQIPFTLASRLVDPSFRVYPLALSFSRDEWMRIRSVTERFDDGCFFFWKIDKIATSS